MVCPRDSDIKPGTNKCSEKGLKGYECTRTIGHKGKHHAHTWSGYCCEKW